MSITEGLNIEFCFKINKITYYMFIEIGVDDFEANYSI